MDVTPLIKTGQMVIESYGSDSITVNGQVYDTSLCLWTSGIKKLDSVRSFTDLSDEILQEHKDHIIIIGFDGDFDAVDFLSLKQKYGGLEVMDVGSACRTYNVLLTEGRDVSIIIIQKNPA